MNENIEELKLEVQALIDGFNWHMTMPEPDLTRKMIEAKARLMAGVSILSEVEERL